MKQAFQGLTVLNFFFFAVAFLGNPLPKLVFLVGSYSAVRKKKPLDKRVRSLRFAKMVAKRMSGTYYRG